MSKYWRTEALPKALVYPEPERVCPEVMSATIKSCAIVMIAWKRWHGDMNPLLRKARESQKPVWRNYILACLKRSEAYQFSFA